MSKPRPQYYDLFICASPESGFVECGVQSLRSLNPMQYLLLHNPEGVNVDPGIQSPVLQNAGSGVLDV